jgi:hypothetical protein
MANCRIGPLSLAAKRAIRRCAKTTRAQVRIGEVIEETLPCPSYAPHPDKRALLSVADWQHLAVSPVIPRCAFPGAVPVP